MMILEKGVVVKLRDGNIAEVVTEKKEACEGCKASRFCTFKSEDDKVTTLAINTLGAKEGDVVSLSFRSGVISGSAFFLYLLPAIGFIGGAILGQVFSKNLSISDSLSSLIFGILGLFLGFFVVFLISKNQRLVRRFMPEIVEILTGYDGIYPLGIQNDLTKRENLSQKDLL